jgi:hypothetical protein
VLRKTVEIEGKSYTLGEATAGVIEDAQDRGASVTDEKEALRIQRSVIAHCLNRGGFSITADELPQAFAYSELKMFWEAVAELAGVKLVPKGEAPSP